MAVTHLCTKADMIEYFSVRGITSFSDHEGTGFPVDAVVDNARERAAEELAGWLYPLYAVADLATSTLVNHWAVILACYYLCQTRGNSIPSSLYAEYEELMSRPDGMIEQVRNVKFLIPGLRRSQANVPVWSNLTVDRRFRREKIRVIDSNSSNITTPLEQDRAAEINRGV